MEAGLIDFFPESVLCHLVFFLVVFDLTASLPRCACPVSTCIFFLSVSVSGVRCLFDVPDKSMSVSSLSFVGSLVSLFFSGTFGGSCLGNWSGCVGRKGCGR